MAKDNSVEDSLPTLAKAMENEHCDSADSQAMFKTPNGATAVSSVEWEFVVCPKLASHDQYPERDGLRESNPEWCRRALSLSALEEQMETKCNALLRKEWHSELITPELFGGRLYTGVRCHTLPSPPRPPPATPGSDATRYPLRPARPQPPQLPQPPLAATCRPFPRASCASLTPPPPSTLPPPHPFHSLGASQPMYVKYNSVLRAKSKVPFLVQQARELCKGNDYVTTMCARPIAMDVGAGQGQGPPTAAPGSSSIATSNPARQCPLSPPKSARTRAARTRHSDAHSPPAPSRADTPSTRVCSSCRS